MAERPPLAMPRPEQRVPLAGRPPIEKIPPADAGQQAQRLGPKFERLERVIGNPDALGELRDDPLAIVPECALVFEVASASEAANFYCFHRRFPKQQPSHNALGKGTVYHQRREAGDAAEIIDDGNLMLDVTCLPTAGELDHQITYAVAATLEVGQDVAVPVYSRIRERLRENCPSPGLMSKVVHDELRNRNSIRFPGCKGRLVEASFQPAPSPLMMAHCCCVRAINAWD